MAVSLGARSFKGLSRFLAPSAGGPLADRALGEGRITAPQLEECIQEQDRSGRPLDEILVERGYLKPEDLVSLRQAPVPPDVARAASDPARKLGHHILVSLLGKGGMAEVWKAWDGSLGRWVAVKFLKPEIGHPVQRLEREGRMAGGLSHPGIISIFERGEHEGRAYLVMPFVDGNPPAPPLPAPEAARLAREVARALAHAHANGVIHRDVKPANLLVESGGRVVLADFGLAIENNSGASLWALSGTPEYASPEQVKGEKLDARTDIYSLGATLYHLLSGRPPFTGSDPEDIAQKVLKHDPPPLGSVPPALKKIVRKAMERDRARRYQSVEELGRELDLYLGHSRPGYRYTVRTLLLVLAAGSLPWAIAYSILWRQRHVEHVEDVSQPLRQAQEELADAERLRRSPEAQPQAIEAAAQRAMILFKVAIRLAGAESPEIAAGMGRSCELLGALRQAEDEYQMALPIPEACLGLARIRLRRHFEGRREEDWLAMALEPLKVLKGSSGGDSASILRLFAGRQWSEVLGQSTELVEREGDDDVLQTAVGLAAMELKNWDAAIARFEQLVKIRPSESTPLYYLGLAFAGKGDRARAQDALSQALTLAPGGWGFYFDAKKRLEDLGR
jgi:tetratricopeptide (TPR) repeat protein